MGVFQKLTDVLDNPTVYRMWQAPFAGAKFEPVLRHNDLNRVRRVLDVGCGPGTNAHLFRGLDYLGLDLNPKYVEQARRRHSMRFEVADVCTYRADENEKFEFVLLNSLLHHIDTPHARHILRQLTRQVSDDGHVHILDLVLPEQACISRRMALADRGHYARPLNEWRELFTESFEPVVFEPFSLSAGGISLWEMVYFKGTPRTAGASE